MAQKSASIVALPRAGDMQRRRARIAYLSLLPVLVILLFVKAYPILATIYRSFTNWDGLYKNDFVGLANYKEFFGSGLFMTLFKNNLVLLLSVPLQVIIGLVVAVLVWFAGDAPADAVGYALGGGEAFAVDAAESKMYRHEIERFGGKAALLADDLNRWLASWTRGRRLALLIAAAAGVAAALCVRAARRGKR